MYHRPVMLEECLEGLSLKAGGTYVDLTFGGGGHCKKILEHLEGGRVIAFDQDKDAYQNALAIAEERLVFVKANFRSFRKFMRLHKVTTVDGILADLGVSSHQFDVAERGFSIRFDDAPLDMRMDQQHQLTARDVLNTYPLKELAHAFGAYGELTGAYRMANRIIEKREIAPLSTTADLKEALSGFIPKQKPNQFLAKVFQALRILVNDELEALQEMLQESAKALNPGGRLVVMSYHSLEDRLVKNFMRSGKFSGDVEKDFYGNPIRQLRPLAGKATKPSANEIAANPRARSARLRVAEKC